LWGWWLPMLPGVAFSLWRAEVGTSSVACAAWKQCIFLVVVKLELKVFVLLRKISANGQWKRYGWRFYPPAFSKFLPRCQVLWWRSTLVFPISASWILVTTIPV